MLSSRQHKGKKELNQKIITNELEKFTEKDIKNKKIEVSIGKKNHFTIKIN